MLNITGNFGNYIEKVAPRWKNILDEAISVINDLTPRVEALESDVEDLQNDIDNLPDFDGGALTFEVFIGGDNAGVQVAGAWSRTGNIVTVAMEEIINIEDTTLSGEIEVIATTSSILDVLKPKTYFPLGLTWFGNDPDDVGIPNVFEYCSVIPNSDNKNAPTAAFQPAFKLSIITDNDPTSFVSVVAANKTIQILPTTFSWSTDAVP